MIQEDSYDTSPHIYIHARYTARARQANLNMFISFAKAEDICRMAQGTLKDDVKQAVGSALAGRAGVACMRTKCQDVTPKCFSSKCR